MAALPTYEEKIRRSQIQKTRGALGTLPLPGPGATVDMARQGLGALGVPAMAGGTPPPPPGGELGPRNDPPTPVNSPYAHGSPEHAQAIQRNQIQAARQSLTGTVAATPEPNRFAGPAFGTGAAPAPAAPAEPDAYQSIQPEDIKSEHQLRLQIHQNRIAKITDDMAHMPAGTPEYAALHRERNQHVIEAHRIGSVLNPAPLPEVSSLEDATRKAGRDRLEMNTALQNAGRDRLKSGLAAGNAGEAASGRTLEAHADTIFPLYGPGEASEQAKKTVAHQQLLRDKAVRDQQQLAQPEDLEARGGIAERRRSIQMNQIKHAADKRTIEAGGNIAQAAGTEAKVKTAAGEAALSPEALDAQRHAAVAQKQTEASIAEGRKRAAGAAPIEGAEIPGRRLAGYQDDNEIRQAADTYGTKTREAQSGFNRPGVIGRINSDHVTNARNLAELADNIEKGAAASPEWAARMARHLEAQLPEQLPEGGYSRTYALTNAQAIARDRFIQHIQHVREVVERLKGAGVGVGAGA